MANILKGIKNKLIFRRKISRRRSIKKSWSKLSNVGKNPRQAFSSRLQNSLIILVILIILLVFIYWIVYSIYCLVNAEFTRAYKDREEIVDQEWKGNSRIHILLIGQDKREGEYGYIDALLVLVLDPVDKSLGIFVLNVDTSIYLPSSQKYVSLRSLYNWGILEDENPPVRVIIGNVESLLSININRYIMIDEEGFKKFVDSLGGVYVNNKSFFEDKDLQSFGGKDKFNEGSFRLSGEDLLNFTRADNDGYEFKLQRQIEATSGLVGRLTSYNGFLRFPLIVKMACDNMHTDLTKDEIVRLGYELMKVNDMKFEYMHLSSLTTRTIDDTVVYEPIFEELDEDIQSVFVDTRIGKEQARVEIFNPTSIGGLAGFRARWLRNIGIDVIRVGDAADSLEKTTIYTPEPELYKYTIQAIEKSFSEEVEIKEEEPDFVTTGDVIIILGDNVIN